MNTNRCVAIVTLKQNQAMANFSIEQLAQLTEGDLISGSEFSDRVIFSRAGVDSRTISEPERTLFFAIQGERNDGHRYLEEAYLKGVRAFVVSDFRQELLRPDAAFLVVPNTLVALQKLAAEIRSQFNGPVVGITGSNGKTVIKEWLHDLLHQQIKITRSPKSYNSQVGVPLSVWNLSADSELAIFEAGISQYREMEKLELIIRPDYGIFTNIGEAHQENFRTITDKIREKANLFKGVKRLVFSADQEPVATVLRELLKPEQLVGWSATGKSGALPVERETGNGITRLILTDDKQVTVEVTIPYTDRAAVENAIHCLVLIRELGLLTEKVIRQFEKLHAVAMRLELKEGLNGCQIVNDYYNSDINSLSIALGFLDQQNRKTGKSKTLILSDIQQSGRSSAELYREVNRLLEHNGVTRLIGIGQEIAQAAGNFSVPAEFYENTDAFLRERDIQWFQNETILLKGAREFQFERISLVLQKKYHQTVLEINLTRLVDNLNVFRAMLSPETKIMVMVKAFSYGSGMAEIARVLQYQRVDYLAVAVADEGIELRRAGIDLPIVVMNPEEHSFESMIEFRLEPNIYSTDILQYFSRAVHSCAVPVWPVHVKLNTGMNRLGFSQEADMSQVAEMVLAFSGLSARLPT